MSEIGQEIRRVYSRYNGLISARLYIRSITELKPLFLGYQLTELFHYVTLYLFHAFILLTYFIYAMLHN